MRALRGYVSGSFVLLVYLAMPPVVFAQTLHITLSDSQGNPVSGAVIEIFAQNGALESDSADLMQAVVDQVDKEFVPRVTTIVAGGEVSFPNSDDILHHVYSFSPTKSFNIPLYGSGENHDYFESFPVAGVVEIGCNIHDWMLAYIYVGESSWMAVSDAQGSAELGNLSQGRYQAKVWHDRLDSPENFILQPFEISVGLNTELSLELPLQRDRRLRRAPSSTRNRYR